MLDELVSLSQPKSPVIIKIDLNTDVWQESQQQAGLFEDAIQLCQKLQFDQSKYLVMVCLSFQYLKGRGLKYKIPQLDPNRKIRKLFSDMQSSMVDQYNVSGIVLPELKPVPRNDVMIWAKEYVTDECGDLLPKIRELYKKQKALPMEVLAERLKTLIDEIC